MSSTGLKDFYANYIDSDIINVNQTLIVDNQDIINLINDISNNVTDLININLNDISGNINDISGNINDISNNVNELWDKVIDLSDNVTQIKISNDLQGSAITELQTLTSGLTAQTEANSGAIIGLTTQTEANTAAIAATITATAVGDIVDGLVDTIDSKVPASYFGSGNVGIYGILNAKFISVVYNEEHFENSTFVFVSNKVLSLKEPYKSLPTSKNNVFTCTLPLIKNDTTNVVSIDLSGYVLKTVFDSSFNTIISSKQNNFTCISPLIKNDISNNISIDLSGYNIGKIKGTNILLNEGNIDSSGNVLTCSYNNPGTYFTDNSFNSFFNFSSILGSQPQQPFLTVYNRMFKNSTNTALKLYSSGNANSNVNSSTFILLDSGSDPTPGANVGIIKFNIATQAQGAVDRFVINPSTSIFYNNLGIGKTPSYNLDISGNTNSNEIFENTVSLKNKYASIFTCVSPLIKNDVSNNISIDLSGYVLKTTFDLSFNDLNNNKQNTLYFSSPLIKDVSNNVSVDLSSYALKNSLNASNITTGTLSVSYGGTGTNNLNSGQILIGSGTNAISQSSNLIFDTSANGLGIGVTQLYSQSTNFQVNNRRLWVYSNPNTSISLLSSDKYGTATTESYVQVMENSGIDFRVKDQGYFAFRCATTQPLTINSSGITANNLDVTSNITNQSLNVDALGVTVNNLNVTSNITNQSLNVDVSGVTVNNLYVTNDIYTSKFFGSNSTSKSLIKFQTKLNNGLYYYNLQIDKYYKTGQNINGNDYKIFNLTSWAEDGFSIINKCTVYISSQGTGIKYIMFYDNWGAYLSNGNQSGWQRDTSIQYMTFITPTQKNIITILENLL